MLLFALVSCVPGAYAFWEYAVLPSHSDADTFASDMGMFSYAPEQVMPGDKEASELGENHLDLVQIILYEASYGLNATKKPIIHNYLEEVGDVVYCSQHTTGGNLKHLMIDSSSETERLYFIITKISDTEYHTFTMRYEDLTTKTVGAEIEAYKTIMVKENGKWDATYSYRGMAKVNSPGTVSRGIDVTSWRYEHRN